MPVSQRIFRSYDIRGQVDTELDEGAVYDIARSIGSEATTRGVTELAVGRDGRLSSPRLSQSLCEGLRDSGLNLQDIGRVPTPLLYYAASRYCGGSGVMLTGSHNPPQYNGIKIMLAGDTLYGEAIQALYQRLREGELCAGEGRVGTRHVTEEYIDEVASRVSLARPLHVVVDCGSGVAGDTAPALLRRLGCRVSELYCEVDGRFPHHHPDPNQPENLVALQKRVLEEGADIGLAFDGDGDRLGVVSCRGEIIWPDRLMMLYARDLLARHPGAEVIYDIKCSRNLGRVIEQAGGRPLMWRTGHSLLKAKMKETGALLAGEMSGHIILAEQWYAFDDALYAAARLLQLMAAEQDAPAGLFDALPDMVNTPELHLSMPDEEQAHQFVDQLQRHSQRLNAQRLTTIDGVRADYADGWGLVRASNTTPTLVLRFEAETEAALERIMGLFKALMVQLKPDLNLPF